MKNSILTVVFMSIVILSFSQRFRTTSSPVIWAPVINASVDTALPWNQPEINLVSSRNALDDPAVIMTKYDMQSALSSGSGRIYSYPDGTLGAVAMMSHVGGSFSDRGTGYNFYNGSSWNAQPVSRIESTRTGWPSYQPFGPAGEIVIAHQTSPAPIKICTRPVKGTGSWTESEIPNLQGTIPMSYARMVTNGPDHTYIHVLAVASEAYNGVESPLLYIRSLDGGATWSEWMQLNGMTSTEYLSFRGDIYEWAQPMGNTIAFTAGYDWQDQFLMKSTDNGTTWTKTIIWPCPYNFWAGGDSVSWFYCPDGTMGIALDQQGMAHIVFGLQENMGYPDGSKFWAPYTDGVIYWNEYMPPFPEVLDPQTLFESGNYIGWVKDTSVFSPPSGVQLAYYYYISMTSNPGISIDSDNNIFVIWSGVTPLLDPSDFYLRHIFERTALINPDHSVSWHDSITDLTSDVLQYNWSECMYPEIAANSDDKIYVLFQEDELAGCYIWSFMWSGTYPGQSTVTENDMIVLTPGKTGLYVGTDDKTDTKTSFSVSANYPNPASDLTTVSIMTVKPGNAILEVTNLAGQKLITMEKNDLLAGTHRFLIDTGHLAHGLYFYTVKLNSEAVTRKMVVD
jgi:hypothetical protein